MSTTPQTKTNHEIYVHAEQLPDGKLVSFQPGDTFREVIVRVSDEKVFALEGDSFVLIEEDTEVEVDQLTPLEPSHHRRHFHVHRCKHIEVHVFYNGEKSGCFRPAATIRKITKWAFKEFGIGKDEQLVMRENSATGEILDPDRHIGGYVKYPHCSVQLFLTPIKNIEG